MRLKVSSLADADIAPVIALWERCGLTRPWNDPHKDIALARATPSSDVLVGRLDGAIIASAMVGTDGHRGYVYYVAVEPDLQGKGYGRTIMQAAQDWARARGCPKFHLLVREGNSEVISFYERLGFERDPVVLMSKRF